MIVMLYNAHDMYVISHMMLGYITHDMYVM